VLQFFRRTEALLYRSLAFPLSLQFAASEVNEVKDYVNRANTWQGVGDI